MLKYDFAGERHPCKYNPNLSINLKYLILNVSNAGNRRLLPCDVTVGAKCWQHGSR